MKKQKQIEEYLKPQWKLFIDEYFRNGFKGGNAYLKLHPGISSSSAEVGASRLLRNVKVREEIDNRMQAEKITDSWIFTNLKDIAGYRDSYRINAAVKALMTIDKAKGMLIVDKKPAFTEQNPAIFLAPYSKEEALIFQTMGRIVE